MKYNKTMFKLRHTTTNTYYATTKKSHKIMQSTAHYKKSTCAMTPNSNKQKMEIT